MADESPKPEATPSPSFSSYEGLGSTVLVALANLIPSSQGRIVATIVAAPLGAVIGRFINWKIQQRKRADVRLIINEEIDDVRKELARADLTPERREKLNDELERLRGVRFKQLLLDS
ncbi:hypothetical protein A0257_06380 [Hymenobacter psoromatis]|nr:hypothetical protein A0257_06380 [Hymenobacter psoromatis]